MPARPIQTAPSTAVGWRRPVVVLALMAVAVQLSFATWNALLNNFAIDRVAFTGREIGILQSIREIPGFLAFGAILLLVLVREQNLAYLALLLLGLATTATGVFPTEWGFYLTTLVGSLGFHYYETMQQSLALQWLPKESAPRMLGQILAAGSFAMVTAYAVIFLTWTWLGLDYVEVYAAGGLMTIAIVAVLWWIFPRYVEEVPQRKKLVLRRRYWLYYALTFMAGARRQIFIVFAGFMMKEKFGYDVPEITAMFLANAVFNMAIAPRIGALVGQWGERKALMVEYLGLICVFSAYAVILIPGIPGAAWFAVALYLLDHAFFTMQIAMKTYFQKIGDPADMAPTAGVAFSINHVAAVGVPISFGLIWLASPTAVFLIGAAMACVSLGLAHLVPHRPAPGREIAWPRRTPAAAVPAE